MNHESLAILASLGSTKEYLGEELSLGDIKKLKEADVLKYYNRYQSVLGKQLHKGLIESFIRTTVKGLSYFLNFDDTEELSKDLQNDELVKKRISSYFRTTCFKRRKICSSWKWFVSCHKTY